MKLGTPPHGGALLECWREERRRREGSFQDFWDLVASGRNVPLSRGVSHHKPRKEE